MSRFGYACRKRRKAMGLTQHEVANRAKMSRTYLGQIEAGHANPRSGIRYRLNRALRWWNPWTTSSERWKRRER